MPKRILVDAVYPEETRVVIHDNKVQEFDYETTVKKQLKGNIFLAKITRVEPSLQAAFVDYGGNRHGFLPFSEIHPDYYQIPVSDREQLIDSDDAEESESASKDDDKDASDADSAVASDESDGSDDDADGEEVGVDEIDGEEPYEARSVRSFYKRYRIQEVIKRNQIVLVQVIKEERGNKGASLTSYVSLAGRYCVLMPNTPRAGGVSRKVNNADDRKRLKAVLENLDMPKGTSVIIRTAGTERNKAEIKRDYDYLIRLWNSIRDLTLSAEAPAFIHGEDDLIKRTIRDLYNSAIDEVLVEGEDAYKTAKKFMKMLMPSHVSRVKQYKGDIPIFMRYKVEEQLASLYDHTATLASGGYIVINPTEALIAIDVNSGKATSERNIEETALKTNLETAREVARQFRLRDLSGLIVIDFIDMAESRNRRAVERELRDALQTDRAKIQIGRISPFGLLEMSRQRLRPSFLEANTAECSHCEGRGVVRAVESTGVTILRALASEAYQGGIEMMDVYASADIVNYMLNFKRTDIVDIEQRFATLIYFHADEDLGVDGFSIEKKKSPHQPKKNIAATAQGDVLEYGPLEDIPDDEEEIEEKTEVKHPRKRRRAPTKKPSTSTGDKSSSGPSPKSKVGDSKPKRTSNRSSGGKRPAPTRRKPSNNAGKAKPSPSSARSATGADTSLFKGIWDRITK